MTAKEYLSQYRKALEERDSIVRMRDRLRESAMRTTPNYQNDGAQNGNAPSDTLGKTVATIVDLDSEAAEKQKECDGIIVMISHVINEVPDQECRTLLRNKYINGLSFEQIARDKTNGRGEQCNAHYLSHELQDRALKYVEEILKKM